MCAVKASSNATSISVSKESQGYEKVTQVSSFVFNLKFPPKQRQVVNNSRARSTKKKAIASLLACEGDRDTLHSLGWQQEQCKNEADQSYHACQHFLLFASRGKSGRKGQSTAECKITTSATEIKTFSHQGVDIVVETIIFIFYVANKIAILLHHFF